METWEIVVIAVLCFLFGAWLGINAGVWYCHQVGKRALARMIESGEVTLRDEDENTDNPDDKPQAVTLKQEGDRWYAWTVDGGHFVAWHDTLDELKQDIKKKHLRYYVEKVEGVEA